MTTLAVLGFVFAVVSLTGGRTSSGGGVRAGRGTSPSSGRVVAPTLLSRIPSVIRFPGKQARLPLPATGEAAVLIPGLGLVGATPHERQRPIASLTKIMTAYIILKDHPLSATTSGPVFTMTAADHRAWMTAAKGGDSNLAVRAGERLDERQLLEALMIPSADNIADYLARWDAGSVQRFVAKMNATATALGLSATHYADASGLSPDSRSTATDQAALGGIAMANPILRSIVDNIYITLPVEGNIWNIYNPAIHVDGIIGVKSGFTQAARACLVTAAWRVVGGRRYLVVSADVGMPWGLSQAAHVDEALLRTVSKELSVRTIVPSGAVVATAVASWAGRSVQAGVKGGPIRLAGWPGLTRTPAIVPVTPRAVMRTAGWPAGSIVGMLNLSSSTGTVTVRRVVLKRSLPPPPAGWTPSSPPQ